MKIKTVQLNIRTTQQTLDVLELIGRELSEDTEDYRGPVTQTAAITAAIHHYAHHLITERSKRKAVKKLPV